MAYIKNLAIRTRLAVGISLLIAAISLFILYYFPAQLANQQIQALGEKTESIAKMTAFSIGPSMVFEDRISGEEVLKGVKQNPDLAFAVVTTAQGDPFVTFNPDKADLVDYNVSDHGISKDGQFYKTRIPIILSDVSGEKAPSLKPYTEELFELAEQELTQAQLRTTQLRIFADIPGSEFLQSALTEAQSSHIHNAFVLLNICYPDVDLLQILASLKQPSGPDRANALEVLDNVLSKSIKPLVFSLLESPDESPTDMLADEQLSQLLMPHESRWIISGALMIAIENPSMTNTQTIDPLLQHRDPVIRETALFALYKIGDEQMLKDHAYRLEHDPDPSVRALAQSLTQ